MPTIVSLPRFARCYYVGAPFLPSALSCDTQESRLLNVSNFAVYSKRR